jgi:hypothetical protein
MSARHLPARARGVQNAHEKCLMDQKRVWGKLWNDSRSYDVQLNLQVRESRGETLFGRSGTVSRVDLLGGVTVEDGIYSLEYSFQGRREKKTVRVQDCTLLSAQIGAGGP